MICHMALENWHLIVSLAGGLNRTIRHLPQARGSPKVTAYMGTGDCHSHAAWVDRVTGGPQYQMHVLSGSHM